MKRRDFIKLSSLASMSSVLLPNRLSAASSPLMLQSCAGVSDRVLVMVRLIGGNDGINTIVPIDQYAAYANLRPSIRVPDSGVDQYINLDSSLAVQDQVGLHPLLGPFKDLYDNGELTVIQGVMYDYQDRSHFKSTDLWMMGGDGTSLNNNPGSGWLARYLENSFPGVAGNPDVFSAPLALQLAEKKPAVLFQGEHSHGISTNLSGQDVSGYYSVVSGIGGAGIANFPNSEHGDLLEYISGVESNSNVYSQAVSTAFNSGSNAINYPSFDLADQLKTVARLVSGGIQTKVFLVSLGGFDTHNEQVDPIQGISIGRHALLMDELAQSMKAFMDDIKGLGIEDRILTATFSEFGRKVKENGNYGTDHGGAAPMFIMGSCLNGGVLGTNVDLSEADDTNNYQIETMQHDYRRIYATLLQDWLGADTSIVDMTLMDNNNPSISYTSSKLNNLISAGCKVDPSCYIINFNVNVTPIDNNSAIQMYPIPARNYLTIHFGDSPFSGNIKMTDVKGQVVLQQTLSSQMLTTLRWTRLSAGNYFIMLESSDQQVYSKEITII